MLLLTKQTYVDQILSGRKTFEIRCGRRYRNIRAGDTLSLNGRLRLTVTSVDNISIEAARLIDGFSTCYGNCSAGEPIFVFHFESPAKSTSQAN